MIRYNFLQLHIKNVVLPVKYRTAYLYSTESFCLFDNNTKN